jgi:signal transduction histidine kinase
VRVSLDNGNVTLSVSDDGRGIAPGKAHGVGLTGMQKRVRQLDGSLKVSSSSRGTLVTAILPATQTRVTAEAS